MLGEWMIAVTKSGRACMQTCMVLLEGASNQTKCIYKGVVTARSDVQVQLQGQLIQSAKQVKPWRRGLVTLPTLVSHESKVLSNQHVLEWLDHIYR